MRWGVCRSRCTWSLCPDLCLVGHARLSCGAVRRVRRVVLHCLPQGMSSPPGYLRRGSPLREVCTVPRLNASRIHLACGVDLPFFGVCALFFLVHTWPAMRCVPVVVMRGRICGIVSCVAVVGRALRIDARLACSLEPGLVGVLLVCTLVRFVLSGLLPACWGGDGSCSPYTVHVLCVAVPSCALQVAWSAHGSPCGGAFAGFGHAIVVPRLCGARAWH